MLNPEQVQLIHNLDQSRMGIYEVLTRKGQFFELRELVINKLLTAHICAGYQGNPGDIIFIRLVPPLDQTFNYSVGMTTPYLLLRKNEQEWLYYFERHDIYPKLVRRTNLRKLQSSWCDSASRINDVLKPHTDAASSIYQHHIVVKNACVFHGFATHAQ